MIRGRASKYRSPIGPITLVGSGNDGLVERHLDLALPTKTGRRAADGANECDVLVGDFWQELLLDVRGSAQSFALILWKLTQFCCHNPSIQLALWLSVCRSHRIVIRFK